MPGSLGVALVHSAASKSQAAAGAFGAALSTCTWVEFRIGCGSAYVLQLLV
jgi:hypothetical protein